MPDKNIDPVLSRITGWHSESETLRSQYDNRWRRNLDLYRGIFSEEEIARSKVRNRSKIFFRKIWATSWRLVASFYNAFLRDPETFKIEGRGPEDSHKAGVLHNMVEYRRDVMMRRNSLFLKMIWGFQNIIKFGNVVGKLHWEFDESRGKDGPVFNIYPNEQVFMDMAAETKEDMRYIIFESYLSKEALEEAGYDNIDEAESTTPPNNQLRNARFRGATDPLQNPKDTEYPDPGRYEDGRRDELTSPIYVVWETFWREDGVVKFAVSNKGKVWFKKPEESVYGDEFPSIHGNCLTEANKLFGEGFPEPLEGAQESLNANLNMRKDNLSLILNKGALVDRMANVDLQSLTNNRPGRIVLTNNVNGVKYEDMPDVTSSAYNEAAADEKIMEETSGVTPSIQGTQRTDKATVARINFSEANAKIDLYIAIVGETFIRDFFSQLARLIQKFETDENVFRIANDRFREENNVLTDDIYELDDFEADCVVKVGLGTVGRDMEIQQTMQAMDRAIMSNQSMIQLLGTQAIPPGGLKLFDTTAFIEDLLPHLGKKDINKYFMEVLPPLPQNEGGQGGEGGGLNQGLAGAATPQQGGSDLEPVQDELGGGF